VELIGKLFLRLLFILPFTCIRKVKKSCKVRSRLDRKSAIYRYPSVRRLCPQFLSAFYQFRHPQIRILPEASPLHGTILLRIELVPALEEEEDIPAFLVVIFKSVIYTSILLSGHFGPRSLLHQDTSALNYSAELSGQFGTDLYETLRHHYTDGFRSVCGRLARR